MADTLLRIATRQSPLALWQAQHVRGLLLAAHPDLQVDLVPMVTRGDIILDTPLAKVGGKGLFVKELEQALLDGRADIAVHSMKDVPVAFPPGLDLAVICQREDPRDALLSLHYHSIDTLPTGCIVGTSSLRRQCQLRELRPDLQVRDLRGNVGTRLNKLERGEYQAIILAVAGLNRLGMAASIRQFIPPEQLLPAVGQGAIGIECRRDDTLILQRLAPLNDTETFIRVSAERALNNRLQGGCQVPIGSYAEIVEGKLWLRALVGATDGSTVLRGERFGPVAQAQKLGSELAEELLARGADQILRQVYQHPLDNAANDDD